MFYFTFSLSNIILPVLFALAAIFYAKLGYMAIFGCCDSKTDSKTLKKLEDKLLQLQTELHGGSEPGGIDSKLTDLAGKLAALQDDIDNKEKQDKELIDLIRKDIESTQYDGVTAGCLKKRNNIKGM